MGREGALRYMSTGSAGAFVLVLIIAGVWFFLYNILSTE